MPTFPCKKILPFPSTVQLSLTVDDASGAAGAGGSRGALGSGACVLILVLNFPPGCALL